MSDGDGDGDSDGNHPRDGSPTRDRVTVRCRCGIILGYRTATAVVSGALRWDGNAAAAVILPCRRCGHRVRCQPLRADGSAG